MNRNLIEAIVGAFVLGAAIFFIVFGYSQSRWAPVEGYRLHANFGRADGLAVGSEVRISGVKVGAVSEMTIDPNTYLAKVTFTVKPQYRLPKDSSAEIVGDGLLGAKYLSLVPGGDEEMLEPDEMMAHAQSSVSLEGLIGKMVFNKTDDKKADEKKGNTAAQHPVAPANQPHEPQKSA